MDEMGYTWPEQEAVEKWFKEHSFELKDMVTSERIKVQRKYESAQKFLDEIKDALKEWERSILLSESENFPVPSYTQSKNRLLRIIKEFETYDQPSG